MSLGHGAKKSIAAYGGIPELVLSLRQLYTYNGPILKIRRDSDNTTQTFSFSNSLYGIPTDDILTFVGAGNGYVETWYDQSGNDRHATNTTLAEQPRIVNSGVLETKNDRPTIVFSGAQLLDIASSATTFGSSFAIAQRSADNQVISQMDGNSNYRGLFTMTADDRYWTHDVYASNGGSLGGIVEDNLSSIFGSDLYQFTGAGTPDGQPIQIRTHKLGYGTPGFAYLSGSVSELVIFPTDIRTKRSYIEKNQMEYHNI